MINNPLHLIDSKIPVVTINDISIDVCVHMSNMTSPEYIIEGVEQSTKYITFASIGKYPLDASKSEHMPIKVLAKVEFTVCSKHSVRDDSPLYKDWIEYDTDKKQLVLLLPFNSNFIYKASIIISYSNEYNKDITLSNNDDVADLLNNIKAIIAEVVNIILRNTVTSPLNFGNMSWSPQLASSKTITIQRSKNRQSSDNATAFYVTPFKGPIV